jgi:DNA-binding MarR family transcriptional regulator
VLAETNPRDRRERRLVPTERGRLMLVESGRILSELVRAWRDTVGDREIDVTLRTLASIDHGRRSMTDVSDWL